MLFVFEPFPSSVLTYFFILNSTALCFNVKFNLLFAVSYYIHLTKMLATTRSRRNNAGAQMAKLLEDLQEDDFYKSTYGGFEESEDDNDFQYVLYLIL